MTRKPILVTGATGYIGGRLAPRLLEAGYRVRVLARSKAKLSCRPWAANANLEIVQGDMLDPDSVTRAADGCFAVYYLVHSMVRGSGDFARSDRKAAQNMVQAAEKGGVERIIYLGGLGDEGARLSKHLRSRFEVAHILESGSVPVTFLRAAVVLGSGGASFEILRYLMDRLPIMITPRWVATPCQPIAVSNVLHYLIGCLEHPQTAGETFDIGGPQILTYRELMDIYVEEAHLPKRVIIPVPFFSIELSSYWIHLITPLPASIAGPLAESLKNPMVCSDNRIQEIIPQTLLTPREAMRTALEKIRSQSVETCWSDAGSVAPPEWVQCGDAPYAGGTILRCAYRTRLKASPEQVWEPIRRIGGPSGWYFADRLWTLRGWLNVLFGGVGRQRSRRHPAELYTGDALDFWRVIQMDPPHRLVLFGEMEAPGEAVLEFQIEPVSENETELRQIGRFLPRGLSGLAYWYVLYPIHQHMYRGSLRAIARKTARPVTLAPEPFDPTIDSCRLPQAS